MSKSIPPFTVSAHNSTVDYDTREVKPTWGFVHWNDHDGNRYGFAFKAEAGRWVMRDSPKTAVVKNPPLLPDGKHRTRYDQGYFNTRRLDANAQGQRAIVEAALAYLNGPEDPVNVDSQRQIDREIAEEKAANEGHAQKIKKALETWADEVEADLNEIAQAARVIAANATVEQLNLLSHRIHGV